TTTTKEIRLKNLSDFLPKNNVLLIDVREPFEFDLNAIKNSVNIPLYSISNKIKEISVSSKNKKIILYCNTGDRSRQAANILKARNINSFIVIPD
ncbi:rhodanese-like domain-containing protein, partial [Salmonella enterica subsp. enterica serovar Java]|nr:rhodanese-like domain-containing protein [Salmonella enterica subsp. enterica serovar Java]